MRAADVRICIYASSGCKNLYICVQRMLEIHIFSFFVEYVLQVIEEIERISKDFTAKEILISNKMIRNYD